MFSNYLKIAWRNLVKNPVFSLINIVGLTLGLTVVMLILLFVRDEVSYDQFHEKGDRLYRLVSTYKAPDGKEFHSSITGTPHGPGFQREIPAIESICRVKGWDMLIKKGSEGIKEKVVYVDSTFFHCFSFSLLKGNPEKALSGLSSAVITNEMAMRQFGTTDVLGKTLEIDLDGKFETFYISGLAAASPMNSSLRFDVLIPFAKSLPTSAEERARSETDWMSSHLNTFVLLHEKASPTQVRAQFLRVFQKYAGEQLAKLRKDYGMKESVAYDIQPYPEIHLNNRYGMGNGLSDGSNVTYSYILLGIAGLILFIASVNFVNLTLARSLRRGKEIGIRKVTGSTRGQLISQFLGESFLLTLLAFFPAFGLVELLLPYFSELSNKTLKTSFLANPETILGFAGLLLLVSFLAGAYPAMVLSRFKPVDTLYGRFRLGGKNLLGKTLVCVQFSIAIFLLIGTFVLHSQFRYIAATPAGYRSEGILRVSMPWGRGNATAFRDKVVRIPGVEKVSQRSGGWKSASGFHVNHKRIDESIYFEDIDANHLPLLEVPIVAGRNFDAGIPSDSLNKILVNESFVKAYFKPGQPVVGQSIERLRDGDILVSQEIIGVVKDYHLGSLREKIRPMVWYLGNPAKMTGVYLQVKPGYTVLPAIERAFHQAAPYSTFSYTFLEDDRMSAYGDDTRWRKIITYVSAISILISLLGLFGLTSLSLEQRTKEIGIRKVLGAGVGQIARLVTVDFLRLILIAGVLAMPLGYYASQQWLEGFAYRISLGWGIFAGAGLLVLAIAVLTIGSQAIKAALVNPVKSLKAE
ncbi:MAG: ABC transporter permease [Siphonobacter aquaeclarae]|nr:ABC transporter permease [Siphonobacter aquaeclarae]